MVLIILISIMISQLNREFTSLVLNNNQETTDSIISLIENNITSIERDLTREANRANIITTVMNPDSSRYYIDDYLQEIKIEDFTGSIHLLSFDFETIKETAVLESDLSYRDWIEENKVSITLLNNHGKIAISSPVQYNNYTEGYLIYSIDFYEIFNDTISLLSSLKSYKHQLKVYINNKEIISSKSLGDSNLSYKKKLYSIPIEIEVLTPSSAINSVVDRLTGNFIVITSIFAAIAITLLSLFTSFFITYPLKKLKRDIERSTNKQSELVTFNRRTANEIITVGKAFNFMHQKLLTRSELIEKSNQELKETQAQLIQNEKMASIGQLASGVAHEINNPTGFVKNNLTTLYEYSSVFGSLLAIIQPLWSNNSIETDKIVSDITLLNSSEDLQFIHSDLQPLINETLDGVERIQKIVQGLRNFARQDKGVLSMGNINQAVENAIILTRNEIKYKCKVTTNLEEISDTMCNLDQLTQVIVNLLINASHAIQEKGHVYISSKERGGSIIVKIADNGSGIPKEILSKLFDPFFSTKEVGKGTGLGLSISKGIIEKHKGEISVVSKPGRGTSFTLKLPVMTI